MHSTHIKKISFRLLSNAMFVFSATKYVKLLKFSQINLASPETTL